MPQGFLKLFLMDWNNHNCHHAETLLRKKQQPNENTLFSLSSKHMYTQEFKRLSCCGYLTLRVLIG